MPPVIHVSSQEELQKTLSKASRNTLVVVDFFAKWCGPCKTISPLFERLSSGYSKDQAVFLKVDIEECPEVASEHEIKSIPTFLFFKNGNEVSRTDSSQLESTLLQLIGSPRNTTDSSSANSNHNKSVGGIGSKDEGLGGLLTAVLGTALPKHHNTTFSGEGHRLGDKPDPIKTEEKPASTGGGWFSWFTKSNNTGSNSGATKEKSDSEEIPQAKMGVDDSLPVVPVQIRLADGSKITVLLNTTQPISKIREFVTQSRPEYASTNFVILTTFPTSEITDETLTIEQASLGHSLVVQRLK